MPFSCLLVLLALILAVPGHANLPTLTVLHTFTRDGPGDLTPAHNRNSDGSRPEAPLVQGRDGAFYGTTTSGGAHGTGVIFRVNADGTGYAVLHSFGPLDTLFVSDTNADGARPEAALVCGKDGTLYGSATLGGPGGSGTVFKLNPDGSGFTILHSFEAKEMFHSRVGVSPLGLTLGPDQTLYGVAEGGEGLGLIFRLTPDGKNFHVLHSFDDARAISDGTTIINAGGAIPSAAVVFGQNGTLYGTTSFGGRSGCGVLYKMRADGKNFAVLHEFKPKSGDNGDSPDGPLTFGLDGTLYGATRQGGATDGGIVYKISADGTGFTVLYTFSAPFAPSGDGWEPSALVFGAEGCLYGVSAVTGETGGGMLFKISPAKAKFFLVHGFRTEEGGGNGGLTLGRDGSLYGVSASGGTNGSGTLFRVTFHASQ